MPIKAQCKNAACTRAILVKESLAGRRVKCPGCGGVIAIPVPRPKLAEDGTSIFTAAHPEVLEGNWRVPRGDYTLNRNIFIPVGSVFEIAAGTRLDFAPGVRIVARGQIVADGVEDARIAFRGEAWRGILLYGYGASESRFSYADFSGGRGAQVYVTGSGDVRLDERGFPLTNAKSPNYGGAVYLLAVEAPATEFVGCTFEDNAAGYGGAVAACESAVIFEHCTFRKNSAEVHGGAVDTRDGLYQVRVQDCAFEDNAAESEGGAVFAARSTLAVKNTSFARNKARVNAGGALYCDEAGGSVESSTFTENSSGYQGGALSSTSSKLVVTGCMFGKNSCTGSGGAVFAYNVHKAAIELKSNSYDLNKPDNVSGAPQG